MPSNKVLSLDGFSEDGLLKLRICDLPLSMDTFPMSKTLDLFKDELEEKKLPIRPRFYFGDEWFSPLGSVAISIPFYFAHPKLISLEKKMMLEVEGEDEEYFLKLLRHETGHCFDHAYGLSRTSEWKKLFGSPDKDYNPETYKPRPYSKAYVRHLDNWYAQAHPVEDFAESFAVWMSPGSNWREVYKKWPLALAKLEYVEKTVKRLQRKPPKFDDKNLPSMALKLKSTLERYYDRRKKESADGYPEFYDKDLQIIFSGSKSNDSATAFDFLQKYKKELVENISYWTGEKKFTVSLVFKRLTERCATLKLVLDKSEKNTLVAVSNFLTTLVVHYQFTGKFRRDV